MKSFLIILSLLALAASKPICPEDQEATTVDSLTASTDKDFYNPTTPRDASNRFTLTYLQNDFPEKPELDDPMYDGKDQPPAEKKPVKRSVPAPQPNNSNKEFFNTVYNSVRPIRGANPSQAPQISLGNLVNAVEHTLVNTAQSATNRKVRSPEISPGSFVMVKPLVNSHNLPILAPLAVSINHSIHNNGTNQSNGTHTPDVAIVQTINTTQYVSGGQTVHVQEDKLQVFTISPVELSKINPLANLANLVTPKQHGSPTMESSTANALDTTTIGLLKKTNQTSQNLQEKLAEVEADPVILTQGI